MKMLEAVTKTKEETTEKPPTERHTHLAVLKDGDTVVGTKWCTNYIDATLWCLSHTVK